MTVEIRVDDEILLRWPTMADTEALFALIDSNRTYLSHWVSWVGSIRTVDDERRWMQARLEAEAQGRDTPPLIVYHGDIAGAIDATAVKLQDNSREIGYWLAQDLQGRGIVTRSCRALLEHLFNTMGMNRVQIHVRPENERSWAIPERLGFVLEGVLREAVFLHGCYYDFRVYSMLASEWASRSAKGEGTGQAR